MKLVIDSNQLQSENLRRYLTQSTSNLAVLTDDAAMEAYKGDTPSSIYKSMSILCDFPRQVVVLKNTRVICGLRGRKARLQQRLIDDKQTAEFPQYVADLGKARIGNRATQEQLVEHGREATSHLDEMLANAATIRAAIGLIFASYSIDERRAVRQNLIYSDEFRHKIMMNVLEVAGNLFCQHLNVNSVPTYSEIPNTFIFRVALCNYLLALKWSANGGAQNVKAENLRNDIVDMNFAAYATYFDGLMSADAKMCSIHADARVWLTGAFGCELPSGVRGRKFVEDERLSSR